MRYCVESDKSFSEVVFDLEPVVQRLGFVVLERCDLGETLGRKGCEPDEDGIVFSIINYRLAEKLLNIDMALAVTLPWRIAVHTQQGATWISLLRLSAQLPGFTALPRLAQVAEEIDQRLIALIDEVR